MRTTTTDPIFGRSHHALPAVGPTAGTPNPNAATRRESYLVTTNAGLTAEQPPSTSLARWLRARDHRCPDVPVRRALIDGIGGVIITMGPNAIQGMAAHADLAWAPMWNPAGASILAASVWHAKLRWSSGQPTARAQAGLCAVLATVGACLTVGLFAVPEQIVDLIWAIVCGGTCLTLAKRRVGSLDKAGAAGRRPLPFGDPAAIAAVCYAMAWVCGVAVAQVLLVSRSWEDPAFTHVLVFRGMEALVVVGLLVNALEAARAPRWTIYLTSVLARLSYVLCVSAPMPGVLLAGGLDVWLFRDIGWRLSIPTVYALSADLTALCDSRCARRALSFPRRATNTKPTVEDTPSARSTPGWTLTRGTIPARVMARPTAPVLAGHRGQGSRHDM